MSDQEKKQQRIYELHNAETKPKLICQPYTKRRKDFFTEKELSKGKVEWKIEQTMLRRTL